jgi:hypothetical protein
VDGPARKRTTGPVAGSRRTRLGFLGAALTQPTLPALLVATVVQLDRGYATDIVLFFGTASLLVWDAKRSPAMGPVPRPGPASRPKRLAFGLGALAFGGMAGSLPRSSGALDLTMALPGLVVLYALLHRRGPTAAGPPGEPSFDTPSAGVLEAVPDERDHPLAGLPPDGTSDRAACLPADGTSVPAAQLPVDLPVDLTGTRAWRMWPVLGLVLAFLELGSFLGQPDPRTDNPDHPTISTVVEPWLAPAAVRAVVIAAWLAMGWWLVRRLRTWSGRPA